MKALSIFSGGLDSMLASTLMRDLGIEVQALFFETPFFPSQKARRSARAITLPLKVIDITERHLEVVKSPKHGYGENLNPCIDCHTLMLRMAGEMLEEEGAHFIISGEVVGQRPMSQNRKTLSLVASESGFEGHILRPLSAKLLPSTIPEEKGWVKRDELMDFSGRSRKPQMELARRFNITDYPSPAGGCLLTDKIFSRRLKDLFASGSNLEIREIKLLKLGRHFRIGPSTKLIVGRNKMENQAIRSLAKETDLLLWPISVPGPTVLILGDSFPELEELAATSAVSYSDAGDGEVTEVSLSTKGTDTVVRVRGRDKKELRRYMI
jgi:tRNA U34 2-thiouridine synthase MnmA/TrmU